MDEELIKIVSGNRHSFERKWLSEYAYQSRRAQRMSDEPGHYAGAEPDYRSPFAHDTDRIIHSHSYARYMDKTQVFFQIKNDHITRRSLHVQMVSRIARTIGRCMKLNEDLIEAIAVGHDIGHTPFGHAGEAALNSILTARKAGTFVHNAQSVRVLQELEHKGKGCDLTLPVLDGILGHNGESEQPKYEYNPANLTWQKLLENEAGCFGEIDFDKKVFPSTLEGCVVRVSDLIAYLGRDFDDAVTLALVKVDALPVNVRRTLGSSNHEIVNALCRDIIENSYGKNYVTFSEKVYAAFKEMKQFNYDQIYGCKLIADQRLRFNRMVEDLFEVYLKDLEHANSSSSIFVDFIAHLGDMYLCANTNERIVADFIAGMTDQYFLKQHEMRFMPRRIDYDEINIIKNMGW